MTKEIHIIYASTSGNTELTVEYIGDILKTSGLEVVFHRAEITPIEVIEDNELFLLATSTWEHGEINPFFNKLLKEMNGIDLVNKKAGFVGCGDIRYEELLFCEGAEILKRKFEERGGKQIYETLKINGDPCNSLDTLIKTWTEKFIIELAQKPVQLFTKLIDEK